MKTFETCSPEETETLAAQIAAETRPGTILLLRGDLGAGKTAFARGFARGLGITDPVSSPTFTIVQEYVCPDGRMLYHMDLYRINDSDAALAFGIDDFLFADNAISLINRYTYSRGSLSAGCGQCGNRPHRQRELPQNHDPELNDGGASHVQNGAGVRRNRLPWMADAAQWTCGAADRRGTVEPLFGTSRSGFREAADRRRVHALGLVASFRAPERRNIPAWKILKAMTGFCPRISGSVRSRRRSRSSMPGSRQRESRMSTSSTAGRSIRSRRAGAGGCSISKPAGGPSGAGFPARNPRFHQFRGRIEKI